MSFFHNRSVFGAPDDDPDVVHLGSIGCDVHFSHYEAGAQSEPCVNNFTTRNLVIKGQVILEMNGKRQHVRAGEWFEIPSHTEYVVECLSPCSLIEFCFASNSTA